jgi:hypothetical protein
METATHLFEQAGLGKAPFKFLRATERLFQAAPGEPVRAGGSCHYCGTGIRYAAIIGSSDGHVFDVGSECVHKVSPALYALYKAELKAIRLARLHEARERYAAANTEAKRLEREAEQRRLDANEAACRAAQPDVARMIDALRDESGHASKIALRALGDARYQGVVQNEPNTRARVGHPTLDKLRETYCEHVATGHVGDHGKRQTVRAEYLGTFSFETAFGVQMIRRFAVHRDDGSCGLLVWKTGAALCYDDGTTPTDEHFEPIKPGATLDVTAKLEHTEWQDKPQTRMTRPKFHKPKQVAA